MSSKGSSSNRKAIVTVIILNDLKKKIPITADMTVQQLFETVCEKLNLSDSGYFSICEQLLDEHGAPLDRFLDFSSTLGEERVNSRSSLAFKVKHVKKPIRIEDPVAEDLIFRQVQQNIIQEIYPCPERIAILLASLELQTQFGDFDPKKHRVGYLNKVGLSSYLPKTVSRHDYAYWQERLFALHARHRGLDRKAAMAKYTDIAREIPYYGMSFFEVKDDAGLEVLSAIAEDGIYLFNSFNLKLLHALNFENLVQWTRTYNGIDITFEENDEAHCISLITTPLKQKEFLALLDEYYALLPDKWKSPRTKPNNPNPIMLDDSSMYVEPRKRVFLGRFGSRLEYLKGYYMESCSLAKLPAIRKFCQQIDTAIDTEESVQKFDLSDSRIGDHNIEFITKSIMKAMDYVPEADFQWTENLDLQRLDLSKNRIDVGCVVVVDLISHLRTIKSIDLSYNLLGNKGAMMLAEAMLKLTKVEELILSHCDIGNKGSISLCESIKWKKSLLVLDLSGNRIDERGISGFIAKYLEEVSNLSTVDLSYNKIGVMGLEMLMKAMSLNRSIETFKISGNAFGNKGGPLIAQMLPMNRSIKHLVLRDIKLQSDSFYKIGRALASNTDIETIDLEGNSIGKGIDRLAGKEALMFLTRPHHIQKLILDNNGIDYQFGAIVADCLKQNKSIKYFSIAMNQLAFGGTLPESWLSLFRQNIYIELMDFSSCGIENLSSILGACESNPALKVLILNENISKEGNQDLPSFLSATGLSRLSIDGIGLSDSIACSVCDRLKSNTNLEFLSIRNNNLTKHGFERMASSLSENRALKTLEVAGNKYDENEAKEIFKTFMERTLINEVIV